MKHRQFGAGKPASDPKEILGSTMLQVKMDNGRISYIRNIMIDVGGHWIIGRNVTAKTDIIHIERNEMHIVQDGFEDFISMVNKESFSFIPLSSVKISDTEYKDSVISCLNGNELAGKP